MSIADELKKLEELKENGTITQEEFEKAKEKLFAEENKLNKTIDNIASDSKTYGMLMHFSQFFGMILPFAGLIIPILMWQMKKDSNQDIDQHGKNITNWIITVTIAGVISALLTFIFIGIPLLIAIAVLCIVFPIMGGLKAKEGIVWAYPLTIKFIK
ncbi:MAG: DUF4870 domain-containing protein [Spirochaetales bacterium]|nr:DUF4870 domain-containing protein [Spirochaetales bacterium]